METVGFIGLGNMGGGMANNIQKAGYDMVVYDLREDTEIGNIGACICMETSYPETSRGLAVNGAEIIYAPTYIEPYYSRGWHELQLRARALDNSCFVRRRES